ncbi:hypothetical protein P691DRAFT_761439 [Macrolepiota fuliginosa MF-IS2]|uniref:Uncharacterized protein n=1 Tax=Macrolepiota fuliginosa MF-IS2 TaxID=1400762 RepID=A0A9P5X8W3_9AGAR|nr:hypothetical protein P691DRAFT_761439 [Macrolepiota fuliginosa MF-IS2]
MLLIITLRSYLQANLATIIMFNIQPLTNPTLISIKEYNMSLSGWNSFTTASTTTWTIYAESAYPIANIPGAINSKISNHTGSASYNKSTVLSSSDFNHIQFECIQGFLDESGFDTQEILITVDFEHLGSQDLVTNLENERATKFSFGLTGNIQDFDYTKPFPLPSDTHLWAPLSISLRQKITNFGLSALGFRKYNTIVVVNIDTVFPDPNTISHRNNTSSLQVFIPQKDLRTQKYQVKQEYRDNSVVTGFSVLGGLWTFLNGTFAIIFGSSLLLVLFGIKPLSVYGLIHSLQKGLVSLAEGPTLSSSEQAHIVALLHEHLMDAGKLEDDKLHSAGPGNMGGDEGSSPPWHNCHLGCQKKGSRGAIPFHDQ